MTKAKASPVKLNPLQKIDTAKSSGARARAEKLVKDLKISEAYPFAHHFFDSPMGAMHFVDEGEGEPILMLHGNPTWSFLYRKFIMALSVTHHIIAPDHIGFGLSDKPSDEAAYSIDAHVRNLEGLVETLDLQDITLVMQDWGGPIGLAMASRHPDRIQRVVILNTFAFYPPVDTMDPENLRLPPPLLLMRSRGIGDFLVRRLGFFERAVMRMATANSVALKAVHHAYRGVFQSAADRGGVMAFPRLIPTNTKHPTAKLMLEESGPYIEAFKGPARIFWGMKDPLFPVGVLDAWRKRLQQARVTELRGGKHYIQEDAPDQLISELQDFLASN